MEKISVEIAEVNSALAKAIEKIDTLNGLIASSNQIIPNDSAATTNEIDGAELINRAEKSLQWSRFKVDTLSLGSGLFADSCWNMCLDIYICDLKDAKVTVSSIAHSSGIPMTTAMRYINVMAEEGLLEKSPNPLDNRMIFISTSATCKDRIASILHYLS